MPRCLLGCFPRIWEQRNCTHEDELFDFHPNDGFLSRSVADCKASDVNRTRLLGLGELAIRTRATDPFPPPFFAFFGSLSVSEAAMNHTMDSCNVLSSNLRTASFAFTQIGLLPLGGLPFEDMFTIVVRLRFWSGRWRTGTCSTFTVIVANTASISCFCFSPVSLPQFVRFWPQNCEPSSSDPKKSSPWFSFTGSSAAYPSEDDLGLTTPTLS